MPETKLFEGKYFGAKRFDLSDEWNIHLINAAGLLNANFRKPSLDYETLLQVCLMQTKNMEEWRNFSGLWTSMFWLEIKTTMPKTSPFRWKGKNGIWHLPTSYWLAVDAMEIILL